MWGTLHAALRSAAHALIGAGLKRLASCGGSSVA